ncbi:nitrilase-related carbon-nitrogen hydrolase [Thalassobacillus devorans]|uniref:nitrilase-related carbon-nitrogen hydrolase n=1 Tax=Thalassobacillus devorans TaxID=279813 RepID=UPI000A1CD678|nr:nitrilase-related carbon-nitrogen hydrolase [Thalassobacillus devorans]
MKTLTKKCALLCSAVSRREKYMTKISVAQITPVTGEKEINMKKMKELIEKAAGQGVELIVFPELALTGYNCGDHFFEVAETIPGQSVFGK